MGVRLPIDCAACLPASTAWPSVRTCPALTTGAGERSARPPESCSSVSRPQPRDLEAGRRWPPLPFLGALTPAHPTRKDYPPVPLEAFPGRGLQSIGRPRLPSVGLSLRARKRFPRRASGANASVREKGASHGLPFRPFRRANGRQGFLRQISGQPRPIAPALGHFFARQSRGLRTCAGVRLYEPFAGLFRDQVAPAVFRAGNGDPAPIRQH